MSHLIAIGDIHGRLRKLRDLLDRIGPTPEDRLVFLGDYVDRGPESHGVLEFLLEFREQWPETVFLMGNHEDFIVSLLHGNRDAAARDSWKQQDGGEATLRSYRLMDAYLKDHREFYEGLQDTFEADGYFFCHAGIVPGIPLNRQNRSALLGIREPFLSSRADHGRIVVHGHTVTPQPVILPNRIGIDTGAAYDGPLTAIELPANRIIQTL